MNSLGSQKNLINGTSRVTLKSLLATVKLAFLLRDMHGTRVEMVSYVNTLCRWKIVSLVITRSSNDDNITVY